MEYNLSICLGGTKVTIGVINLVTKEVLCTTERIEWSKDSSIKEDFGIVELLNLIANYSTELLERNNLLISKISRIGLTWPGPGNYKSGLLTATFIPNCQNDYQQIFHLLREQFHLIFKDQYVLNIPIFTGLDVNVRAHGELHLFEKSYCKDDLIGKNGIVFNLATGIAGAFIEEGKVVVNHKVLGENYGQWGRFLIKNLVEDIWYWKSTRDGSVPEFDPKTENRLSKIAGGPSIFKRILNTPGLHQDLREYGYNLNAKLGDRDIIMEKEILTFFSRMYYEKTGNKSIEDFMNIIADDIGKSIDCLLKVNDPDDQFKFIILTGGIGEYFGRSNNSNIDDKFLARISLSLGNRQLLLVRSKVGIKAELLGCALIN